VGIAAPAVERWKFPTQYSISEQVPCPGGLIEFSSGSNCRWRRAEHGLNVYSISN
jgi:hypothetical protein